MELNFNSHSAFLYTTLAASLVFNLTIALRLYFVVNKNIKRSKRITENKGNSSGILVTGDHNVITYVKDIARQPYEETTQKLEEKSQEFEKARINTTDQWARFDPSTTAVNNRAKTGFTILDQNLGHLEPGQIIAITGLPGSGKTTFALDLTRYNSIKNKLPVLFFSLGSKVATITDKLIAAESRLETPKIKEGLIGSEEEFALLRNALESLANAPIFIDDTPYSSIETIERKVQSLDKKNSNGLIIIDGIELLDEYKDPQSLLIKIKRLSSNANLPLIFTSQLSRFPAAQRGGHIRTSDIPEQLTQIADVVIALNENWTEDKPYVKTVSILKNRNGACAQAELYFDEAYATFLNIEFSGFGSF